MTYEELVIPDDTHHFMRHANLLKVNNATVAFFDRILDQSRKRMNTVKTVEAASEKVQHFPSILRSGLLFEPQDGFLTCPYCGYKEEIRRARRKFRNVRLNNTRARPEQMGQLANNALEVQCQNCGAKSLFMPPEVAGRCEFCGVQIVAQPKSADPIMAPEGCCRSACHKAGDNLRQWLSSLWFAPSGLKQFAQPGKDTRDLHSVLGLLHKHLD